MFEDAADIPKRFLRKTCVLVTCEDVRTFFRKRLMDVHPATVIANQRLRHEGRRFAERMRHVVYAVLQDEQFTALRTSVFAAGQFRLTAVATSW